MHRRRTPYSGSTVLSRDSILTLWHCLYVQADDQDLRAEGLISYCRQALAQQASLLLPVVRQSYEACPDLAAWRRLDDLCQVIRRG